MLCDGLPQALRAEERPWARVGPGQGTWGCALAHPSAALALLPAHGTPACWVPQRGSPCSGATSIPSQTAGCAAASLLPTPHVPAFAFSFPAPWLRPPCPHLQQRLLFLEGLVADGVGGKLHPDDLRLLQPGRQLLVGLGELGEQGLGVLQLHGAGSAAQEELLRALPQCLHRGLRRRAAHRGAGDTGHGRPPVRAGPAAAASHPAPTGAAPARPLTWRCCCRGSGQERSSGSEIPSRRSTSPRWCRISAESSWKTEACGCQVLQRRRQVHARVTQGSAQEPTRAGTQSQCPRGILGTPLGCGYQWSALQTHLLIGEL